MKGRKKQNPLERDANFFASLDTIAVEVDHGRLRVTGFRGLLAVYSATFEMKS